MVNPKEVDDVLDQATPKTPTQAEMPEAVASVTYSIISSGGFPALFTVRAGSGTELLARMKAVEAHLIEGGYKPQEPRGYGNKPKEIKYVEGQQCPECGGRLVENITKTGKKNWSCENRKYDFKTKEVSGCQYIAWK